MIPVILRELLKKKVNLSDFSESEREEFQRFLDKNIKIKDLKIRKIDDSDDILLNKIKEIGQLPEEERFDRMLNLSKSSDRIFRLKIYNTERKSILEDIKNSDKRSRRKLVSSLNKMPTYKEYFFWRGFYVLKGNKETRESALSRLKRI